MYSKAKNLRWHGERSSSSHPAQFHLRLTAEVNSVIGSAQGQVESGGLIHRSLSRVRKWGFGHQMFSFVPVYSEQVNRSDIMDFTLEFIMFTFSHWPCVTHDADGQPVRTLCRAKNHLFDIITYLCRSGYKLNFCIYSNVSVYTKEHLENLNKPS